MHSTGPVARFLAGALCSSRITRKHKYPNHVLLIKTTANLAIVSLQGTHSHDESPEITRAGSSWDCVNKSAAVLGSCFSMYNHWPDRIIGGGSGSCFTSRLYLHMYSSALAVEACLYILLTKSAVLSFPGSFFPFTVSLWGVFSPFQIKLSSLFFKYIRYKY